MGGGSKRHRNGHMGVGPLCVRIFTSQINTQQKAPKIKSCQISKWKMTRLFDRLLVTHADAGSDKRHGIGVEAVLGQLHEVLLIM
jgi:hypothetical protein